MELTIGLLKGIFTTTAEAKLAEYIGPLNALLPRYEINTPKRVACFLAQTGHESARYSVRVENLNYSAAGLRATFPKYFPTLEVANLYARKPERIANRVYANRMGNSHESSGDGWRYRGKGILQITGKNNHVAFAKWAGMTLDEATVYMLTAEGAVLGAIWYWITNNLNALADTDQITKMTKVINGGTFGLEERKHLWTKFLQVLR
jgi:putative chitinase